jgi:hypothetical protein
MKKFKTTGIGGLPIVLDDLRWTNEALKEVIGAIVSDTLIATPVIIKGCVYDADMLSDTNQLIMTAGYVYMDGEIFAADAVNLTLAAAEQFYWNIVTTFDAAGLKVFQNSSSQDTYEIRKLEVLKADPVPGGKTLFSATKETSDLWREKLLRKNLVTPFASFLGDFAIEIGNEISAVKGLSGEVTFSGLVNTPIGLSVANKAVGALKTEFKPKFPVYIRTVVLDNSDNYAGDCIIEILPTGTVNFISQLTSSFIDCTIVMNVSYILN